MKVLTRICKNNKFTAENLLFCLFIAVFAGMPLGTSPPIIFGVLALAVWIFSGQPLQRRYACLKEKWCRPVLLLIIIPWLGLLYSADNTSGLGIDYAGKVHYWFYGLCISTIASHVDTEKFVLGFLLGLTFNAFIGLLQLIGLYPSINGWYCGLGRGYSTLSAYLVIGILITSFYFTQLKEKKSRILAAFLMTFYFFHLSILDGRTGYITFFALSPMLVRNLFGKKNIIKVLLVCALLTAMMCLSPIVRNRIQLTADQLEYHLNAPPDIAWGKIYTVHQDRFYMWRGAVDIFLENPLFGVGTGGYQTVLKERGKPEWPSMSHPHNDILYMAASYGVIGIFAFFWLFLGMLRNSWKQRHTVTGYFILSSVLVILVSGLFNGQLIDSGTAFLLALTAGLQQHLSRTEKESRGGNNPL